MLFLEMIVTKLK